MTLARSFMLLWFATATALHAQQPRAVLLELFTSEGCSSCPPADALLKQLNNTRTPNGDLIIALSEHVTYWNQLGWRDPFSTDAATARQEAYRARFRQDEVYTPQAVVNGEAQVLGSDRAAITQAFGRVRSTANAIHIKSVRKSGAALTLAFSLTGPAPTTPLDVYAVVAEDKVSSSVPRGENGGRTLTHVAVATNLTKIGTTASTEKPIELTIPRYTGAGSPPARHLVVFAQLPDLGGIVSVDTVPL